jgi:hypothetical protein
MEYQIHFLSTLTSLKHTFSLNKTSDETFVKQNNKNIQESIFEDILLKKERKFSFDTFSEKDSAVILNLSCEKKIRNHKESSFNQTVKSIKNDSEDNDENLEIVQDKNLPLKNRRTKKLIEEKIGEELEEEESGGCKCKNSKCLRLHCACFKTLGYCGPSCRCLNCLNQEKFKEARNFVIQKTKIIYKKAFQTKNDKVAEFQDYKIHKEGCNCKKGCNLKYCQCKKFGANCSPICRCESCINNKVNLTQEEIRKIYKPCSRKKHKIIIKEMNEEGKNFENIYFESYKKK